MADEPATSFTNRTASAQASAAKQTASCKRTLESHDSSDPDKDGKITREEWEAQVKFRASGKNVAFALAPGGTGNVTRSHVAWKVTRGLPYIPSPLVYRGLMYTVSEGPLPCLPT